MDKEKQIEEMAVELIHAVGDWLDRSRAKSIISILLVSSWVKLHDNEVVISKEEREMLVTQYKNLEIKYNDLSDRYRLCKDANETIKQHAIMARKETAKEILSTIGNMLDDFDSRFKLKDYQWHRNMCKKYGVEIGE